MFVQVPLRYIHQDVIDGDIWIIPAENMKRKSNATTKFFVLLSSETFKIFKQVLLLSRNDFFFSASGCGPLTAKCMAKEK